MITAQRILDEFNNEFSEYLEMMSEKEQLIVIKNALAQKLAYEMTMKDHYKICFEKSISKPVWRINS